MGYEIKDSIQLNIICACSKYYDPLRKTTRNHAIYFVSEPISAKSPTIEADNKFIRIERRVNQPMALFCNSQSFPIPVFRFVMIKVHPNEIPV